MRHNIFLCITLAMLSSVPANAQLNLNKLQKAAKGVVKQIPNVKNPLGTKSDTRRPSSQKQTSIPVLESPDEALAEKMKLIEEEEALIDAMHFNQKNDPAFSRTSMEATWEFIRKSPIQYPSTKCSKGWDYYRGDGTFALFEYWDDYVMPKKFPKKPENIKLRELQMEYRPLDITDLMRDRQFGLYGVSNRKPHLVFYDMQCYASIEMMDYLLNELKNNGFTPTRRPSADQLVEMENFHDYKWEMFSNDYYAYMTCRKSIAEDNEYLYWLVFIPNNQKEEESFDGVPMPIEGYPNGDDWGCSVIENKGGDHWEYNVDRNFNGKNKPSDIHWERHNYEYYAFTPKGFDKYCERLEKAGFTVESKRYDDGSSISTGYQKGNYRVYLLLNRDEHTLYLSATDWAMLSEGW